MFVALDCHGYSIESPSKYVEFVEIQDQVFKYEFMCSITYLQLGLQICQDVILVMISTVVPTMNAAVSGLSQCDET